ncbi:MAG: hypothetical protein ACXVAA_11585 [Candidatus Binataceae bacterium]
MAFAFVAWRLSIWQLDQPIRESAYLNWATPSTASNAHDRFWLGRAESQRFEIIGRLDDHN